MTLEVTPLPRPGACVLTPSAAGAFRPMAVGYASAAWPVETGAWTRWHAGIESHAYERGLPLLRVFSDDESSAGGGLRAMADAIRSRAHQRDGHLGFLIVPSLEHLSPARDGSHQMLAWLLNLHFGCRVDESRPQEGARGQSAKARGVAPGAPAADELARILRGGQVDSPLGHPRSPTGPRRAT